jgi:hypothetical protein
MIAQFVLSKKASFLLAHKTPNESEAIQANNQMKGYRL